MENKRFDIVKIERKPECGLQHWNIYGLNIFHYNHVPCAINQRPDVLFLTDLTARLVCAAHVGSLALSLRVDTSEEMFGPPDGTTPYSRTRVGFSDGFYDPDEWPRFDACFFPHVTSLFWQALLGGEDDLEQLLGCHGMAFYAAPRSVNEQADITKKMQKLLAAPFPGEAQWLTAITELYGLALTVGHDGQYFHVYAQDESSLQWVKPSLSFASQAVEESEWFQTHKQELVWDDDLNECLMLSTNDAK